MADTSEIVLLAITAGSTAVATTLGVVALFRHELRERRRRRLSELANHEYQRHTRRQLVTPWVLDYDDINWGRFAGDRDIFNAVERERTDIERQGLRSWKCSRLSRAMQFEHGGPTGRYWRDHLEILNAFIDALEVDFTGAADIGWRSVVQSAPRAPNGESERSRGSLYPETEERWANRKVIAASMRKMRQDIEFWIGPPVSRR